MEHTTDSALAPEYERRDSLISELRKVNAELLLQKEMYKTLSRVSPVGMFRTNRSGKVEYINAKGIYFFGIPGREFLLDKDWTDLICEEDRELTSMRWKEAVEEETNFVAECRFQRSDGKIIWALCQANLVNGGGKGHVGTITDITPQREILGKLIALKENYKTSRCNGKWTTNDLWG